MSSLLQPDEPVRDLRYFALPDTVNWHRPGTSRHVQCFHPTQQKSPTIEIKLGNYKKSDITCTIRKYIYIKR